MKPADKPPAMRTMRLLLERGADRARSHCCFVLLPIHFIPDSLTCSAPLFLKRQCDRTLGADPNALTDKGLCPLFTAAVINFTEAIPLLLEHGALVDTPSQGQGPGVYYTAFHVACSEGFLDCVEALVRAGCDTSIEALGGGTGEQLARTTGQTAVLELLELLRAEQLADLPAAVAKKKRKKRKKSKKKKPPASAAQQERDGLVRWGSAAFSLCTTAHALYTRITNRCGGSLSETAVRPNP